MKLLLPIDYGSFAHFGRSSSSTLLWRGQESGVTHVVQRGICEPVQYEQHLPNPHRAEDQGSRSGRVVASARRSTRICSKGRKCTMPTRSLLSLERHASSRSGAMGKRG